MYKKVFNTALIILTAAILLFPQLGNAEESINKASENNKYKVELIPPADGFSVGTNELSLNVSDAKGNGVTGAVIAITPWMPGMGHGVMLTPTVTETGKGNYKAENVGFSMPGHWELIVSVSKENIDDKATFTFADIAGGGAATGAGVACNCGTGGNCPSSCLCGCQAGIAGPKCNMKGGKCLGNCSCGCQAGKPCQIKDGKCSGGCSCGCQAGAKAQFNCPCGTGGNCPAGCGCGCQAGKIPNCKCGPGCTALVNCSCGPDCKCPMDGKGGCGCTVGCRSGCPNGVCTLPIKVGTT
jgi:hypothetical protein